MPIFTRDTLVGLATSSTSSGFSFLEDAGGPITGDVRYLFIATTSAVTVTAPTGWSTITNATWGTGKLAVFWKAYVVGEGFTSVSLSAATNFVYHLVVVGGSDLTTTPQGTANGGTGTTLTASGTAPIVVNSLDLVFFAYSTNSGAVTLSTPSGFTRIDSRSTTSTTGEVGILCARTLPTLAATGTATSTAPSSRPWRASRVIVAPSPTTLAVSGQFLSVFGGGL